MRKPKEDYSIVIIPAEGDLVETLRIRSLNRLIGLALVSSLVLIVIVGITCVQHRRVKKEIFTTSQQIEELKGVNQAIQTMYNEQAIDGAIYQVRKETEVSLEEMEVVEAKIEPGIVAGSVQEDEGIEVQSISRNVKHEDLVLAMEEREEVVSMYEITYIPCDGEITSHYGWRSDPFGGGGMEFHNGIDIAGPIGTPIYAAAAGIVEQAGWENGYGNVVYINHGKGNATKYAHNSELLVSEGELVEKGQMIAKMGSTGNSTGPHLHFEIIKDGERVDPYYIFKEE